MKHVVVALLVQDNCVLTERRSEKSIHSPGKLRFPAGHVEKGESPEEAVRREMMEELGITITGAEKVHEVAFSGEDGVERLLHYFLVNWRGSIDESPMHVWLDRLDADKMSFPDDQDLIRRILDNK